MSRIKAITIWQPYATLLAIQAKQHETRSWYTSYRGPIAIGRLNDCVPADLPGTFSPIDRELGWFGPGRWAWRISDIRLIQPYLIRGQQGLWDIETGPLNL